MAMEHQLGYGQRKRARYPFRDMAVSDWFMVPADYVSSCRRVATWQKQRRGKVFMTRFIGGNYICTRIE